ncbi:MAG: metallophosphoesterase family protein [Ruminococcaceae bacterium]|nr:metallophosphoesterase family protein [Oscillospiraceae bacterium]
MKILIVSDIHGRGYLLSDLLDIHFDRDGLIFLGDGVRDLPDDCTDGGRKWFTGVAGNCDWLSLNTDGSFPNEILLDIDGFKVLAMHGHTQNVKSGYERAAVYASKREADILLFGHTHETLEKYIPEGEKLGEHIFSRPLYIFNPGSLGAHSYGLLQIKNRQILFSHGSIK